MAGKVSKLEYQKRNAERANVYLDGEFAFGLPALEAAKLHVGQYLSDADVERLRAQDAFTKAYERALRFLSFRPRSRTETERNLKSAGLEEDVVQAVLERLAQEGYLNDAQFARFWVDNREQFKPRGDRALRHELRQKGLDDQTVNEALSGLDPVEGAYRAAQARVARLAPLLESDRRAFRQRLGNFLLRRGFGYEVVRAVVRRLEAEMGAEDADSAEEEG